MEFNFDFIPIVDDFFTDNPNARFYVIAGGRGKGATWGIGDEILFRILTEKREHFVLCSREINKTVDESSRRTIETLIKRAGIESLFDMNKSYTLCKLNGSKIVYNGLSTITEDNIQGYEGLTMVWLGEAHTMQETTWQKLEPTVRATGSIIFIDYNSQYSTTPIHRLFTESPTMDGYPWIGKKSFGEDLAYLFLTYRDNPEFPLELDKTRLRNIEQYSKEDYDWIWEGKLRDASEKFICDESIVLAAMKRDIPTPEVGRIWVGADIAHMGGDEIVFYKRLGKKTIGKKISKLMRTPQTKRELEAFMNYDKEVYLNIDNGHVGGAVADEMEESGYTVNRINFGGKDKYYDPEHSADTVTDMAFNLVNEIKNGARIPHDPMLITQICQRKWNFLNEKGIRKIEPKDKYKERIKGKKNKSPDRFDALMLTYYEPEAEAFLALPDVK